jgi:hypothetical protein
MGTTEPLPVTIVDINLATMVLILGVFFIVVGIIIAGVVYRESREWKKLIIPMFDRDPAETTPGSAGVQGGLTPRMSALGREVFGRVFTHMDVAGLLGGAAIVVLGLLVLLIGLTIGSP